MSDKNSKFGKRHSYKQKKRMVQQFIESGMTRRDFSKEVGITSATLSRWIKDFGQDHVGRKSQYSPEQRRHAVEEFFKSGLTQSHFSKVWGIDSKTLHVWIKRYRESGPQSLEGGTIYGKGKKRGKKPLSEIIKKEILVQQEKFPTFGLKKIQNILYRFNGIKVSPNSIKKTLLEAEVYEPKVSQPKKRKAPQVRRFERARPMQLWQTDITSFVLPRSKDRVYLVVFMDDHSRYIVSWSLALKQTGQFVIDSLVDGMEKFGRPEEVLSDQGRQYFSWRGRSEFQRLLEREGVKHVVSRSHHPQTLGKCERFWKTVDLEFWNRARPQTLDDAIERFKHFVNHYNHFRPHQGLKGMVPADRFFDVEDQIREELERNLSTNELKIAIDEKPKKPFYFMGQIGEQKISMHGEKGELVVRTPEGELEGIKYGEFGRKENGREKVQETEEKQLQNDCKTSDTSERIMESSDSRAEREGPYPSDGNYRLLDRHEDEARGGEDFRSHSIESLADEQDGREWDVCRPFETAEDEKEYVSERRRSEISEETDQRVGIDYRDTRSLNPDFEEHARLSGSDIEEYEAKEGIYGYAEEGSETWQDAKEERGSTYSSELESENPYWKINKDKESKE